MNNLVDNLKALSSMQERPSYEGKWMAIQMRPDFASGEKLNIGVVFYAQKSFAYKLLDDFRRIRSIYGEAAEDEFRFLIGALNTSLQNRSLESPTSNVSFTHPSYAAGETPESIALRIFNTTVSLGKPRAMKCNLQRSFAKNTTYVRSKVFSSIKQHASLLADDIIADPLPYLLKENNRTIALDVPLRPRNRLGSIVSAAFFQRDSIELSFFRAWMNLVTASALTHKNRLGLFVFYPSDRDYWPSPKKHAEAGNIIDFFEWRLRKQNIRTSVNDQVDGIAKDIINWVEIS